jgi:hypothetical protein
VLWSPASKHEVVGVERKEAGWIVSLNGHGDALCPNYRTRSVSRHRFDLRSRHDCEYRGWPSLMHRRRVVKQSVPMSV